MKNIVIIGSSGHAKVVIDIVQQAKQYQIIGLLDRFRHLNDQTQGYPVLGREEDLHELAVRHKLAGVIVAIGDNYVRSKVAEEVRLLCPDLTFVSAIHPAASIAKDVLIDEGTVIMAGAIVNPCSSIGRLCIVNTKASLDHDSRLGDYASLAPGATTGGNCEIGDYSAIGIGAVLIHGIHIGEHSVIGAGATVLKPIQSFRVAYGTPAVEVRERKVGDRYL